MDPLTFVVLSLALGAVIVALGVGAARLIQRLYRPRPEGIPVSTWYSPDRPTDRERAWLG